MTEEHINISPTACAKAPKAPTSHPVSPASPAPRIVSQSVLTDDIDNNEVEIQEPTCKNQHEVAEQRYDKRGYRITEKKLKALETARAVRKANLNKYRDFIKQNEAREANLKDLEKQAKIEADLLKIESIKQSATQAQQEQLQTILAPFQEQINILTERILQMDVKPDARVASAERVKPEVEHSAERAEQVCEAGVARNAVCSNSFKTPMYNPQKNIQGFPFDNNIPKLF